ncbi:HNH endonuclease [Gordonia sp. TBRC 11910]|uniref:HNH endonuclease n=1 Tax=Gordonia asplenii TaxID=2725283 RepID=A0A848KTR8_9ACTN|nr:HNH endonuclease signature motif containing protein [Gordonia asplenii]NMO01890.1 HNH endonuclease [Gordonia asplenii]
MAFWWASQGKNHPIAIQQGSLWTCPWFDGRIPTDRALIKDIQPGDVVFHYQGPFLRAVSTALTQWQTAPRPEGYPKKRDEDSDTGWLVTVKPLVTGLEIDRSRIAELLPHGSPGPLDERGLPQQKYLSALTEAQGHTLLAELDAVIADTVSTDIELVGSDAETIYGAGFTDAASVGSTRIEQAALRAFLADGRSQAACALCGRILPMSMLVAAHIKPRSKCTDQERRNFSAVAILACVLGCDALFERGYIAVDESGTIVPGRAADTDAIGDAVARLVGNTTTRFDTHTAPMFAGHRELIG